MSSAEPGVKCEACTVMSVGWACEDHHPASQKTSLEWVCVNELSARPLLVHLCHRVSLGKGYEMEM